MAYAAAVVAAQGSGGGEPTTERLVPYTSIVEAEGANQAGAHVPDMPPPATVVAPCAWELPPCMAWTAAVGASADLARRHVLRAATGWLAT